jgi:choline dehydrogenase-like flavoprotein
MGRDPFTSVVDPTHETHDIHNLFITDGSSVPGSLGVNPQMTIMAMATRAAEFVSRRLERLHARAAA